MEENVLKFKAVFYPEYDRTYSVCMRGARTWNKNEPLLIYTGDFLDQPIKIDPKAKAEIVSQQHYRFSDVPIDSCGDNYDKKVTNWPSLRLAMEKVYGETFNVHEIVTILRFKII